MPAHVHMHSAVLVLVQLVQIWKTCRQGLIRRLGWEVSWLRLDVFYMCVLCAHKETVLLLVPLTAAHLFMQLILHHS